MRRRRFLRSAAALAGTSLAGRLPAGPAPGPPQLPLPTPAQLRWQDAEFGIIFHLDMPVVAGDRTGNNATRKTFDPKLYQPKELDTDQWLAAAKSAGARYAIFTATHFNGFLQWQSDLYPYGCKQAAWRGGKGDVVADFVASCHKAGLQPGLYLSTHRNAWHQVWGHYVDWGKGKGTPAQAAFNKIAEGMTRELCSRYGPLFQIWFDAGVKTPDEGGPDVLPIFAEHQPDAVFYHSSQRSDHRWIGNEAGHAGVPCWATMPGPEAGALSHNSPAWRKCLHNGDPAGSVWSPGMVDTVLRGKGAHDWFWRPGSDHALHTTDELLRFHDLSVGRNANLVLGVVVDNRGLVPEGDVARLAEFGRALAARYAKPLGESSGTGKLLELKFPSPEIVSRVAIMEDIAQGERIRGYRLHGLTSADTWTLLAEGESVGHRRIQPVANHRCTALRLTVTRAQAEPVIRKLAAF